MKLITKLTFVIFIIYIFQTPLFSQKKESFIWYFGENAGLDFNTDPPTALLDGELNVMEGCATISDKNGKLLFYTDGMKIWNKEHKVMPNGLGLLGDISSTQSGIIVPQPGSSNIYYVFTVATTAGINGLRYSMVDINLDGGLGDIIADKKNLPLNTPVTEKLTAVKHANGKDIWVITHGWKNNEFLSYLLTDLTFNETPVVSSTGMVHDGNINNTMGYLKASINGNKIAACIYDNAIVEVFDFNTENGNVSNPITIDTESKAYGVEFSPNGSKLYVSCYGGYLNQYDISSGIANIIKASEYKVDPNKENYGAIQIGPDQKLYITKYNSKYLSVIESPNEPGALCNYKLDDIYLEGKASKLGLPNFIQTFFSNTCEVSFKIQPISCITKGKIELSLDGEYAPHSVYLNDELIATSVFNKLIIDADAAGAYHFKTINKDSCIFETIAIVNNSDENPLKFRTAYKSSFTNSGNHQLKFSGYGGIPPYQFSIDGLNYQASGVFSNIDSGIYTAYLKDSGGCLIKMVVKL